MPRAVIINPPFLEPHRPPVNCAILAEVFRRRGYDITMVDLNIELFHAIGSEAFHQCQVNYTVETDDADQRERVKAVFDQHITAELFEGADLVAIACFSYWHIRLTREACQRTRAFTQAPIILGGAGLEYDDWGKKFHSMGLCDFYVIGEGEIALDRIIAGEHHNCPGVNGVPPEQINDIENLPLPNYGYFDLARYDWLLDGPDVFIVGSRGCVRKCTFCDVAHFWPKFRQRSGASIADEMIRNYELHGIRYYFFADSLINGSLKEYRVWTERLARYQPGLFRWSGMAIVRPKGQHSREMFDIARDSGAMQWQIGVETGVDRIRYEMQKKFTNEDIDWHLEQSQRIGLRNLFLMIPTWHTETPDEHQQYLSIFPRWRPYAIDGTISGINLSATVEMLDTAPVGALVNKEYRLEELADANPRLKTSAWISIKQPELTHREKFRRTLAVIETAIANDWPIHNRTQKISELRSVMSGLLEARRR